MALHLLARLGFTKRNGLVNRKVKKNGGHHRKKMMNFKNDPRTLTAGGTNRRSGSMFLTEDH